MKAFLIGLLALGLVAPSAFGLERRRNPFSYRFGYFVYPIVQEIPGLGKASGVGATVVDIAETDLDFGGFYLDGEFKASGAYFLNQHLIPQHLVLDWGAFTYDVTSVLYDRGIDSSQSQYILPQVKGQGYQGQMTLMFVDRMLEGFLRQRQETYQVHQVFDADGTAFANVDQSKQDFNDLTWGAKIDYTDDRQDPRRGVRWEWIKKIPENQDLNLSAFEVIDQNLTLYLPLGQYSTWAFNGYRSDSVVTRRAETDPTALATQIGLGCGAIPDPAAQGACRVIEDKRVAERSAFNRYGRATPLGGTQRLRAFPNGRFAAGHSRFLGTELRWNLNDENTPFDYILMKGVRTGFQLAAFYEVGTVSDQLAELDRNYRHSAGAGLRVLFEGVTVRLDVAQGEEGGATTLFIDYPWGLSAVDNSTR